MKESVAYESEINVASGVLQTVLLVIWLGVHDANVHQHQQRHGSKACGEKAKEKRNSIILAAVQPCCKY